MRKAHEPSDRLPVPNNSIKTLKADKKNIQKSTEPEEEFPVDERHDVRCKIEHKTTWHSLVKRKRLEHRAVIAELCQHHLVLIDKQWAGRVTIVLHTHTHRHSHTSRQKRVKVCIALH